MNEWKPIEDAPRDGAKIDVWVLGESGGYRETNVFWGAPEARCKPTGEPPSWVHKDDNDPLCEFLVSYVWGEVAFFMPIPAGPQEN